MKPVRIKSLSDPGIEAFTRLSDKELERRGLFLAESPNVILRALENGFEPAALFCEETVLKKGSSAGSAEAAVGPAAGGSEAVDGFEAGGSEAAGGSDMEKLLSYFRRVPVY